MQKRIVFGIVLSVVALDCYIKNYTTSNKVFAQEQPEKSNHKLLQKIKPSHA